jgi:hypothetical protein
MYGFANDLHVRLSVASTSSSISQQIRDCFLSRGEEQRNREGGVALDFCSEQFKLVTRWHSKHRRHCLRAMEDNFEQISQSPFVIFHLLLSAAQHTCIVSASLWRVGGTSIFSFQALCSYIYEL